MATDTGERTVLHGFDMQGLSNDKPSSPYQGQMFYDIGGFVPEWWNDDKWREAGQGNAAPDNGEASFMLHGYAMKGVTAQRPASPYLGQMFFDLTIGHPIWWTGTTWTEADNGLTATDTGERTVLHGCNQQGPTADRPPSPYIGCMYFDTDFCEPVWWDGTTWNVL